MSDSTTNPKNASANCTAGKVVIGGGVHVIGTNVTVTDSYPTNLNTQWTGQAVQSPPLTVWQLQVFAICATQ